MPKRLFANELYTLRMCYWPYDSKPHSHAHIWQPDITLWRSLVLLLDSAYSLLSYRKPRTQFMITTMPPHHLFPLGHYLGAPSVLSLTVCATSHPALLTITRHLNTGHSNIHHKNSREANSHSALLPSLTKAPLGCLHRHPTNKPYEQPSHSRKHAGQVTINIIDNDNFKRHADCPLDAFHHTYYRYRKKEKTFRTGARKDTWSPHKNKWTAMQFQFQ